MEQELQSAISTIRPTAPTAAGSRVTRRGRPRPGHRTALLAFGKRDPDGRTDVAVVERDGTGERVLVDIRPFDGDPSWSPDGSTIAFRRASPR